MNSSVFIAAGVLVLGIGFLVWKGKASYGTDLAKSFSEKKVLLIEFILFVLIFLHAHTAAELAVRAGGDYLQRFLLHSFLNSLSFIASMGVYKNGKDVGEAILGFKRIPVVLKELAELGALLLIIFGIQWFTLWVMCVGFEQPYIAALKSKTGTYLGFVGTLTSIYDFMLATSVMVVCVEALMTILLAVTGSASAVNTNATKSTASKPKGGGLFGAVADLFGAKPTPTTSTQTDLHTRAAKIIGSGSPGMVKQSIEDQRLTSQVKTLCDRHDTATNQVDKAHIANQLRGLL